MAGMAGPSTVLDPEQLPDYDPDDEPDDEPEGSVASAGPGPRVYAGDDREWEFRTENLTLAEVTDGKTIADRLNTAAKDGWHLVFSVDAGDSRVLVLRRPRRGERTHRAVGF